VKQTIRIPVAVKLSPFFSNVANMVNRSPNKRKHEAKKNALTRRLSSKRNIFVYLYILTHIESGLTKLRRSRRAQDHKKGYAEGIRELSPGVDALRNPGYSR